MGKTVLLIVCIVLLLAGLALGVLAVSYHRVLVVEGISGTPIAGAYVTVERASGSPEDVGRTDANGRLSFWTSLLPLPKIICAQSTFYGMDCVRAIGLGQRKIELAVPAP